MRIAHLINPVRVDESRDLHFQQPITFESMRKAKEFSGMDVEQWACFYPEDEDYVPEFFEKARPLAYSTEGKFKVNRKLPYFWEMLDRLYESSDADYFIQTNADIGVMPHFYNFVYEMIQDGNESFCINKRIVPEHFKDFGLGTIWSVCGNSHAGHDCFVFPRGKYPLFKMGEICMGTPWSETTLITNLVTYCKNFTVFKNAHATFHLGDRRIWLPHEFNDYRIHNTQEFARILRILSKKKKKILKHPTIKYLLGKLKKEVEGYKNETYSKDCWYFIERGIA